MESPFALPSLSVSNLVLQWDDVDAGGGSAVPPAAVERVVRAQQVEQRSVVAPREVEQATIVAHATRVEAGGPAQAERMISPPEYFDAAEPIRPSSSFAYDLLDPPGDDALDEAPLPALDYDDLRRRDIARELLRARLVAIAEQREHRSAYEIAFILLSAAVAVLLAAPPLVQVLLAAHGTAT